MTKKLVVSLSALLLLAAPARAEEHSTVDVFAGYSYVRGDFGNRHGDLAGGGIVSGAYNFNRYFGAVAEWSTHHDTIRGVNLDSNLGLFGGRVYPIRTRYVTPFVHALVGFHNTQVGLPGTGIRGGDNTGVAFAAGTGFDINLHRNFAFRALQADYLLLDLDLPSVGINQATDNLRLSSGIVFRWGE